MEKNTVEIMLSTMKMKCPLCKGDFRLRTNLRHHFKTQHTQEDAEKYLLKKI